jgi:hypothetical protein
MAEEILQAIAWPLAAVAIAIIAWRSGLIRSVVARVTKLSAFNVSVDLATIEPREIPGLDRLRDQLATEPLATDARSILQEFLSPGSIDYAVIDLKDGRRWLASRLFRFCEFLVRQRGLQCVVFVHQHKTLNGRFVGIADPRAVKWAIAGRYPWMESALAHAYELQLNTNQASPPMPGYHTHTRIPLIGWQAAIAASYAGRPAAVEAPYGRLSASVAEHVVQAFLAHPNIQWTADSSSPQMLTSVGTLVNRPAPWSSDDHNPIHPPSGQREWTRLRKAPDTWEHSPWLDASELTSILGQRTLHEDEWVADDPHAGAQAAVRGVLGRRWTYVAVVNENRCFRRVIDRREVLEAVAREELERFARTKP